MVTIVVRHGVAPEVITSINTNRAMRQIMSHLMMVLLLGEIVITRSIKTTHLVVTLRNNAFKLALHRKARGRPNTRLYENDGRAIQPWSNNTMNPENTSKLFQDFPELFRDSERTGMQYGFQTDDGWFELIYELCRDVEKEALKAGITRGSDDWPKAQRVKEKLGTLRFYIWNRRDPAYSEAISKLVADAADRSATICEDCGAPGILRHDAWIHTACDACNSQRIQNS